ATATYAFLRAIGVNFGRISRFLSDPETDRTLTSLISSGVSVIYRIIQHVAPSKSDPTMDASENWGIFPFRCILSFYSRLIIILPCHPYKTDLYRWISTESHPCYDCRWKDGEDATMVMWRVIGFPGEENVLCGARCICLLLQASLLPGEIEEAVKRHRERCSREGWTEDVNKLGGWECPECGVLNYRDRTNCYRCNEQRNS
ncbi:MAG TPA: zinc finger Ran-binding domain-containing protein, partial [bacterium]|nr:zinc finger Ran-binding domain-containing protein [bacterium]